MNVAALPETSASTQNSTPQNIGTTLPRPNKIKILSEYKIKPTKYCVNLQESYCKCVMKYTSLEQCQLGHDKRYQDVYGSLAEILNICANKIQVEA